MECLTTGARPLNRGFPVTCLSWLHVEESGSPAGIVSERINSQTRSKAAQQD